MELEGSKILPHKELKFWKNFVTPNNILKFVIGIELLKCLYFVIFENFRDEDYSSYHDQARIYLQGEKNYELLYGTQGQIAYPALHLYTYALIAMNSKDAYNPTLGVICTIIAYLIT